MIWYRLLIRPIHWRKLTGHGTSHLIAFKSVITIAIDCALSPFVIPISIKTTHVKLILFLYSLTHDSIEESSEESVKMHSEVASETPQGSIVIGSSSMLEHARTMSLSTDECEISIRSCALKCSPLSAGGPVRESEKAFYNLFIKSILKLS